MTTHSPAYSKTVWFDGRHNVEVFRSDDEIVIGTIIAYEGAVFLINPRPEILAALYQESKLKRILGIGSIVLTSADVDMARGLCSLVNYSRVLLRRAPLAIITSNHTNRGDDFITRCCGKLASSALFTLEHCHVAVGQQKRLGRGSICFGRNGAGHFQMEVLTDFGRRLHFYDEEQVGTVSHDRRGMAIPDVVVRAGHPSRSVTGFEYILAPLSGMGSANED